MTPSSVWSPSAGIKGVAWEDNLPLSLDGVAHFTVDTLTDTQKSRFFSYLRDLKPTRSCWPPMSASTRSC